MIHSFISSFIPSALPVLALLFCVITARQCRQIETYEDQIKSYQKTLETHQQHLQQKKAEERKLAHDYQTLKKELQRLRETSEDVYLWGDTDLPLDVLLFLQPGNGSDRGAGYPPAAD